MLEPEGDNALSVDEAREWAKARGIPFIQGSDLIDATL